MVQVVASPVAPLAVPIATRPLLKWVGGKRQLLPALRTWYPAGFSRYVEPFFGSGAVFFDLLGSGRLEGQAVRLVDKNSDLVGCYQAVREQPEAVVAALRELAAGHATGGERFYYEVRDGQFNPARAAGGGYTPALAAMFIYLNRTGFNGLFRLNRRGVFNVPAGRYDNPHICDSSLVHAVAAALRAPGVSLVLGDFQEALSGAGAGDFVYCDPPYAPLSRTASFASYTADGFTAADQECLQACVVTAASRGATILLSNSCTPEIEELYQTDAARRAGLVVHRVPARRAINSRATSRGPVDEVVVTNAVRRAALDVPVQMLQAGLRRQARRRA